MRIIDGLVDLPFALPTAVAGIALTSLYSSNGWIGRYCEALGLKVAYTPLGIIIALVFIHRPGLHRAPLRGADGRAHAAGFRCGRRGGGCQPRCEPLADPHPGDDARTAAGPPDRVCTRLRPGGSGSMAR
jgi:hypothetical protein